MLKNLKIIVLIVICADYGLCSSNYLQRLALPAIFASLGAFQINKVADCNSVNYQVNPALFSIHKNASDFVRDPLSHSVTKWRRSSDWKNKIWAPNAQEHTEFSGYQFDGFGHGYGSFTMQRQGDNLSVTSDIVAEDVMSTSSQNGLSLRINGIDIGMHSGMFKFEQSDLFTKCTHTIHVGKKPASKMNKIGNIVTNRASCDNLDCNNEECVRLRKKAALYDVISVAGTVMFEDNAPKVVRTSNCVSLFPMDKVFARG